MKILESINVSQFSPKVYFQLNCKSAHLWPFLNTWDEFFVNAELEENMIHSNTEQWQYMYNHDKNRN